MICIPVEMRSLTSSLSILQTIDDLIGKTGKIILTRKKKSLRRELHVPVPLRTPKYATWFHPYTGSCNSPTDCLREGTANIPDITCDDLPAELLICYKVVQIWPGQTVTLHTNSPGHIWTTLYNLLCSACICVSLCIYCSLYISTHTQRQACTDAQHIVLTRAHLLSDPVQPEHDVPERPTNASPA